MMSDRSVALKATLLLIASLTIMAGTTVAPSLPAIEKVYAQTPHAELLSRMVLTLPAIFVAISAPVAGVVVDRLGRKALLVIAMLLYGIAGMSGLWAQSLHGILVGRAALGIAIGGIMTVSTTLVGDNFSGPERERYLGLQQAFTQFGGVAFVTAGGLMTDLHWRAPFAIYAASFLILPAVFFVLKEHRGSERPAVNTHSSETVNWPQIALICLAFFMVNALFYTVPSQLPFFLRESGQSSGSIAGYALALFNLAGALIGLSFGRLRSRLDVMHILASGLFLMATGSALLSGATEIGPIFVAVTVMGTGLGVVMPSLMSLMIRAAPAAIRGRIVGLGTASMFLGHFTSPLASQPWISWFGFGTTFRDIAIFFGLMALVTVLAGRPRGDARTFER